MTANEQMSFSPLKIFGPLFVEYADMMMEVGYVMKFWNFQQMLLFIPQAFKSTDKWHDCLES
uniref:Uncharacterized protein n=1 Tax=Rhizophora mucronata TaxID=61149 RepID=A0A2P2QT01_RHIMU